MNYQEINITDIEGIKIGHAQDFDAMTGATVMIFDHDNVAGVDISGGGPASRETPLLSPLSNPNPLNAILLSGGSAYGLDASGGVMKYLEERNIGFPVGNVVVPLVCQSCIFDLGIGNPKIRPDQQMGYLACVNASNKPPKSGIIGAGTGATVGKMLGMKQSQKSGIGFYAMQVGDLKIGAMVVVNALGDIFKNSAKIAGMLDSNRKHFINHEDVMEQLVNASAKGNTTIGVVVTNANFNQQDMAKIASMARSGYSQSIKPVGTMADGDTIYAVSLKDQVTGDINVVGTLASKVISKAIEDALANSKMDDEEYLKLI